MASEESKPDATPATEVNSVQITVNNTTPTITVETVANNNNGPNMEGSDDEEKEDKNFKKPPVVVRRKNLKVILQPGYSQLDWVKLSYSGKDLAGTGGLTKRVPMSEVKKHNKKDDAWMVFRGKVYNITPYMNFHPGGVDYLMKGAGRDGTKLYDKFHPWVNGEAMLEKCFIGYVINDIDD